MIIVRNFRLLKKVIFHAKDDEAEAAPVYNEQGDLSGSMAAYMTAISKTEKFGRALDKPTVQR